MSTPVEALAAESLAAGWRVVVPGSGRVRRVAAAGAGWAAPWSAGAVVRWWWSPGAGIGSVSWICSPRTGAATPASAGPGEITVVTGTTVVVVTGDVVVVTSDVVVDVDVDVDVDVLGRGGVSGNDGSPEGGWRRASTTVTSTARDSDGSDPWSIWLITNATTTAATTPHMILEPLADTWCSSRGRTARP